MRMTNSRLSVNLAWSGGIFGPEEVGSGAKTKYLVGSSSSRANNIRVADCPDWRVTVGWSGGAGSCDERHQSMATCFPVFLSYRLARHSFAGLRSTVSPRSTGP